MRKTHHGRGKGHLAHHLGGKKVKQYGEGGKALFAQHAKKPEPDNVGRKMRPAAHGPRQAGVAKRARATVRRLSDRVI